MDTNALEVPHGTVGYSRKVQPAQYESAEMTVFIPFDMPVGVDAESADDEFLRRAKHAATQAKALVLEELGLEFELGPNGVLQEIVRKAFPGATNVTPTASAAPALTGAATVGDTSPHDPRTSDRGEKDANKKWAEARRASHPDEFYDNRAQKQSGEYNAKGPDFKHKNSGVGLWV